MTAQPGPTTSGVSVAALVCGVLGIVLFFIPTAALVLGALALVLGIFGLRRANAGTASGRGLAIAGIALGAVALVLAVFIVLGSVSTFDGSGGSSTETRVPPP